MYSPMSCITGCTVDGDIEFIDDLDGVFTQCADCADVDDPPVVADVDADAADGKMVSSSQPAPVTAPAISSSTFSGAFRL